MAKKSEAVEAAARAMADLDGHNPDLPMVLGVGVPISINGHFAYTGEPRPIWHAYAASCSRVAEAWVEAGLITFDPE